jgi:hypothetical protein
VAVLPAVLSPDLAVSASANPTVTVANTAANPVPVSGSITVGNSVIPVEVSNADPIPVTVSDSPANPARMPFSANANCTVVAPSQGCDVLVNIPSDKALVIETVGAEIIVPRGLHGYAALTVQDGNASARFPFVGTFAGSFAGSDIYMTTLPVRAIANKGSAVTVTVAQEGFAGGASMFVTFAGYLVPCGSGTGCTVP